MTAQAKAELGDLDAAIGHVDRMLAISGAARDAPDARVGAMLNWIEAQMLDSSHVWRNRRLILFTEWDDTRRWLVERLKEGLLQRSGGRVDLNGRILVFAGQTSLEERDRIKIAFNAPFDREPVRILVCTDAAREGLNLQARCHDLIHVDLPWNPSRLEQRNGRIDRKLQPSKVVTCRYFFYDQREEDRVLDALVRKTEVIRRQLGASGEVLRMRIEKTLTGDGIQRGQPKTAAEYIQATSRVGREPPPTMAESELDEIQLAIGGADLARTVEWLPAIERFGEGIFLHVAPEFVKKWLDSPEIIDKAASFRDRERRDAERFNRPPVHFGAAYWALHSLSHAFMAELALECGYPLSSLKERIYSSGPAQPDRFGILIYTSTAGGQGTLGGLSSMAEQAGDLLARATKRLALCSNDPICAEHADGTEDYPLQGAACHACLLVLETSCESRNTRLDRGLLTATVLGGGFPLFR